MSRWKFILGQSIPSTIELEKRKKNKNTNSKQNNRNNIVESILFSFVPLVLLLLCGDVVRQRVSEKWVRDTFSSIRWFGSDPQNDAETIETLNNNNKIVDDNGQQQLCRSIGFAHRVIISVYVLAPRSTVVTCVHTLLRWTEEGQTGCGDGGDGGGEHFRQLVFILWQRFLSSVPHIQIVHSFWCFESAHERNAAKDGGRIHWWIWSLTHSYRSNMNAESNTHYDPTGHKIRHVIHIASTRFPNYIAAHFNFFFLLETTWLLYTFLFSYSVCWMLWLNGIWRNRRTYQFETIIK